jgi:FAD synthetase
MKRIVATGTFDILHPGHVHYLAQSRALGDELHVIVARDKNVMHKPKPVIPEDQRLIMVQALKPVDYARLGDKEDMFRPIMDIQPDIITLGYNQHFDLEEVKRKLSERGLHCDVVRIDAYPGTGIGSSRRIMEKILQTRCPGCEEE